MSAGQWTMGWFLAGEAQDGISHRSPQHRPRHLVAGAMGPTMSSLAGRFFEPLGRFPDGLPAARKPVVSGYRAVRTVRTVFPISRQEVEKKRDIEKGKVEIRKYRPNRLTVLHSAAMRASARRAV